MTAPTFFKPSLLSTDSTGSRVGSGDWDYLVDVLDGSNATDRVQTHVVEGHNASYDVCVYISGTTIYARKSDGSIINSGVAGTNDSTVIQAAFDFGGTTASKTPTVVLFKPGLYKETGTTPFIRANTTVIGYGATLQSTTYARGTFET